MFSGHNSYHGAHMGGAHMGQDEQVAKVQQLVEKKAQLEAALPVVDDNRAMQIEARLDKIEAQLQRELARAQAIGNESAVRAAMGLDGMGGLDFQSQAPAGIGRLLRLPFYPSTAGVTNYTSGGGAGAVSTDTPVITYIAAGSGGANNTVFQQDAAITLTTPQISWATLRIVGFEVSILSNNNQGLTTNGGVSILANSVPVASLVVKDLKIGGGANLFTHEDFADGKIYDASQPEFCGLRDYPLLKSPNTATVQAAVCGIIRAGAVANAQSLSFSCALLTEVLQDDNYGSHIPGPYARGNAMVRRGGSFIS